MMIDKRILTGCFAAALLAAGGAQAQFYVRADGAFSSTTTAEFKDVDPSTLGLICGNGCTSPGQFNDFGNGAAVSVGAGTRIGPGARTDITATIRKYKLDQSDKGNPPAKFQADVTSAALMGNIYFEFSEGGVTPYLGLSAGAVVNKLGNLSFGDGAAFQGTVPGEPKLGFGWGASFGFSFPLASHLAIDIAFRYFDLGTVQTKSNELLTIGANPPATYPGASGNLRVHEIAAGLRF
jgi:opacity protein-like surface antigen